MLHLLPKLAVKKALPTIPSPRSVFRLLMTALLITIAAFLGVGSGLAQSASWSTAGSGNWSTGSNWSGGTIPTSTTTVTFNTSTNQPETITLSTGETAQGITINQTGSTGFSGGTLLLGSGGITISAGAGQPTFGSTTAIELVASQTWNNQSSDSNIQTQSGFGADAAVVTPVTLTIENTGSGSWDFKDAVRDNNTAGGGTVSEDFLVTAGGLILDSGTNSVNTGGDMVLGGTVTVKNAPAVSGGANTSTPFGLGTLTFGTGSTATTALFDDNGGTFYNNIVLTTGDTTTWDANNTSLTFAGVISGNGALISGNSATGVLTLSGANTFSGGLTANSGVLNLQNSSAVGTGTFTLSGGTVENTTGTAMVINNALTISSGTSFGTSTGTSTGNITFSSNVSITGSNTLGFTSGGTGETVTFSGVVTNNLAGTTGITTTVNSASATNLMSFSNNYILGSANTAAITDTFGGTGNIAILGVVSNGTAFANALSYVGSGTTGSLALDGDNTYTGGTTVSGTGTSTLDINNGGTSSSSSAIGTGALKINGGTIDNTSGAALTLGTNNAVTIGGNFSLGSATATANDNINFGTGPVSSAGSYTITFTAGGTGETMSFGGVLSNTGAANTAITTTVNSVTGGDLLSLGGFTLGTNDTAAITDTFAGSANIAVTGAIINGTAHANGLTYSGTGTLTLSGGSNTYSGATMVTNGTLQLGDGLTSTGLSSNASTGGLKVTGGSLLFANPTSAAVGASNIATTLGGGTIGFASTTAASSAVSLGALTLTAATTSILSFSGPNQTLTFNSLNISNTANTILNIYNYVAGDSLFFTTTTSPSTAMLNDITFFSDAGTTSLGNAVEFGTMGQVIPGGVATPEPSTYLAAFGLLVLLASRQQWGKALLKSTLQAMALDWNRKIQPARMQLSTLSVLISHE